MLSSVTLAKEEAKQQRKQAPNSAVGGSNCTAWREEIGGCKVAPMYEVGLNRLLGRPLKCGLAHVGEGEHEDVGTGRRLVNEGESEMEKWLKQNQDEVRAWDDVTGKELDAEMVWEARRLEMKFVRLMGVYRKARRSWAKAKGEKIIGVRWIDINKGDNENLDL